MKIRYSASILITAVLAAGCGSDDETSSDATSAPVTAAAATTSTSAAATTTESPPESTEASAPESTDESMTDESTGDSSDDSVDDSIDVDDAGKRFDLARQALEDGDFSVMLEVLDLSNVADDINENQVTILSPTNDAFGELTGDQYGNLIANPTQIDDVIRRHILDTLYTFDELSAQTEVTTIDGDTLTVTNEDGVVKVDGATVTEPDNVNLTGEKGQEVAVYALDKVLLEDE